MRCVVFALGLLGLLGCRSPEPAPIIPRERVVEVQHGIASRYTDWRTASGERYSSKAYAAAHRYWPFGTRVRVINPETAQSVIVRINDRGPFIRGRVIDLTPAAAEAISLTRKKGITRVVIQRLM